MTTYSYTSTTDSTWNQWVSTTTSSTTSTDVEWETWATTTYTPASMPMPSRETQQAMRKRIAEREENARMADHRSKELLLELLDENQRNDLELYNHFYVQGKKNRYRIRWGHAYNVDVLDERGIEVERVCAVPKLEVPTYDHMLAQKLFLEQDERAFLKTANHQAR